MTDLLHQLNRFVNALILALQLCLIAGQTGLASWDPAPFSLPLGILVAVKMVITLASWRRAAEVTDELYAATRTSLIEMVAQVWIADYLDAALADGIFHFAVEARVNKRGMRQYSLPAALHEPPPWSDRPPAAPQLAPAGDIALGVFRDVKRKIALVGEPGGGKTILLLQLADALLQEARADADSSVPLLFDLASWTGDAPRLDDWLAQEMETHYGFRPNLARAWIRSDRSIYLLDGLDEVPDEWRGGCINAINKFMTKRRQIIVSCRRDDFAPIADALEIKTVVEILPLAQEQVREALERDLEIDKAGEILQEARRSDEIWRALSRPLVVGSIARAYDSDTFAYRVGEDESPREVIRRMVIEPLVDNQLREAADDEATAARYRRTLSWLAHCMRLRNQNKFYLETMQGDWLPAKAGDSAPLTRFVRGLRIKLESRFDFSLEQIIRGLASGLSSFLFIGLPLVLVFIGGGIFASLGESMKLASLRLLEERNVDPALALHAFEELVNSTRIYAAGILSLPMIGAGVIWSCKSKVVLRKRLALGEGFWQTLRFANISGLFVGFVAFAVFVSSSVYVEALFDAYLRQVLQLLEANPQALARIDDFPLTLRQLAIFAAVGLLGGAVSWFVIGYPLLSHSLLRAALVSRGLAPRRLDAFLERMLDAGLMRQVGGGLFFAHRELLDYFAEEWASQHQERHGSARPLPPKPPATGLLARLWRKYNSLMSPLG